MTLDRTRALWIVIGVLAAILVLEWIWPAGGAPGMALPPVRAIGHAATTPLAARDTSGWGDTILQRPLFSISRRPARVVRSAGGATIAGQARLSGVMITRQGKRAIFAPEGGGKTVVLAEGASINDSKIQRILPDRVLLASGAVLMLTFDKNGRTSVTPFQPPFNPGFPNPGFPQPGMPNLNFNNPNLPNPAFPNGFPNPVFAPQPPNANQTGEDGLPLPPRNPMIPQRRE